jgi:uncharacterized protein (DUF2164 family)
MVKEIMTFFQNERDEEVGIIAATSMLDFFIDKLGRAIYERGIEESKKLIIGSARKIWN